MKFKYFIFLTALLILIQSCSLFEKTHRGKIEPLANDYIIVCESPNPETVYLGTPGIIKLQSGRLIATVDFFGPGVKDLPGIKGQLPNSENIVKAKIFTSDDDGKTWTHRLDYPFYHARPFAAGSAIYILGHCGDLMILKSEDEGETWSEPVKLTEGETWHASTMNVLYANDCVYLVMEKRFERGLRKCWRVGDMAPILMRGKINDDLTQVENWTFASSLVFEDVVTPADMEFFGVPFFQSKADTATWPAPGRGMSPIGWLETNVVQFTDPNHIWTDSTGHTFHLWMRAHTGGVGYANLAKVVEQSDGSMVTQLETVPSGKKMLYVPFPGGQMKFFVLYDEKSKLFWMVGTQATDSMIRPGMMPADRYNLPNNERRRLVLHFSKNMVDWCFAGLVAVGPVEQASRHYASMTIDDNDLLILSRSGDENALNPHNGNLITLHRVNNFRELVY